MANVGEIFLTSRYKTVVKLKYPQEKIKYGYMNHIVTHVSMKQRHSANRDLNMYVNMYHGILPVLGIKTWVNNLVMPVHFTLN